MCCAYCLCLESDALNVRSTEYDTIENVHFTYTRDVPYDGSNCAWNWI